LINLANALTTTPDYIDDVDVNRPREHAAYLAFVKQIIKVSNL